MKATIVLAAAAVLVMANSLQAEDEITSGTQPIFIPATELEWFDLDPENAPGVQLATLWGDPARGAFGAYMLLPAGFDSPLHRHSHPMKVVFVSGTYIQEPDGEPVVHLGPGSFMMQPGGDYWHRTSCGPESDCVFFVESAGAFDLFVVEDSSAEE
jgi:hypothetical protein